MSGEEAARGPVRIALRGRAGAGWPRVRGGRSGTELNPGATGKDFTGYSRGMVRSPGNTETPGSESLMRKRHLMRKMGVSEQFLRVSGLLELWVQDPEQNR